MRIAIVLVLVLGCGKSARQAPEVTRERCNQVADHIAKLIMDHFTANPDELWAELLVGPNRDGTGDPYETGVPKTVTKETFKAFLASPEGKTWVMQRQGQVRSSAEPGIQACVDTASPALVQCLLATNTREEVVACDRAHPSGLSNQAPPRAAPGSANAASGSNAAPGSATATGSSGVSGSATAPSGSAAAGSATQPGSAAGSSKPQ